MMSWRESLLSREATLLEAMKVLEKSPLHFVVVVDDAAVLLGTVTDGDVRRALLRGRSTAARVDEVMNPWPIVLGETHSREEAVRLMHQHSVRQLPVVNAAGQIVGVEAREAVAGGAAHEHVAVVMAGGEGRRLRPLTEHTPKPLLPVNGRPALELVIDGLVASGFRDVVLCVNYLADMIIDRIGDGSRWGIDIRYVRENDYLGTAGSLAQVCPRPTSPFLVINADVLTRFDFRLLFDFHAHNHAVATMCVRQFEMQVPYGVIRVDDQRLTSIEEKPMQTLLINAGIYVLDPSVLDQIAPQQALDMTTLFQRLAAQQQSTHVFPLHEYWLDIGRPSDLHRANAEFHAL